MSRDVVTGIRLLRAVMMAQRDVDVWRGRHGRYEDHQWFDANEILVKAKADLDAFIAGDDLPEDFKLKQAGERNV